ncbi:hypothetical protein KEM54_005416 [Ascosphaera aggregata]|nr:hypothetical protein KEM54_005416 [Ascosphaera aggregata]
MFVKERPSREKAGDLNYLKSTSSPVPSKRKCTSLDTPTPKDKAFSDTLHQATLSNLVAHHIPECLHNCSFTIPQLQMTTTDVASPDTGGKRYDVETHDNATILPDIFEDCVRLVELTSGEMYRRSSFGWSMPDKKKQMADDEMRFLVLVRRGLQRVEKDENDENLQELDLAADNHFPRVGGFLSFMVTEEEGLPVIYVYEIHLHPALQGRSIGSHLLSFADSIGSSLKLSKVMLTVFRRNHRAIRFYRRHGFQEDEISPRPRKLRNGRTKEWDYVIMSKELQLENGKERPA